MIQKLVTLLSGYGDGQFRHNKFVTHFGINILYGKYNERKCKLL